MTAGSDVLTVRHPKTTAPVALPRAAAIEIAPKAKRRTLWQFLFG
jgi:hypothetical protein